MHIQFPTSITLLINQWPPIHDTRYTRRTYIVLLRSISRHWWALPPKVDELLLMSYIRLPSLCKKPWDKKRKGRKKKREEEEKKKSKKRRYFSYTISCTSFIAPAFPPPPPPLPSFVRAPLFSPISRGPKVPPRFIDGETHRRHRRDCARY